MQCSPLQLIPVCFLILALTGHFCASQDNPLNHYSIVIRDQMVGIPHRNRDTLWKRPCHKQNPDLVAGGAQSLQLFCCAIQVCNLGTNYLRLRAGLRFSCTHNNSTPIKIWQAIPVFLFPLFTFTAMKRILMGIQDPQGKLCAQKPPARHTLLPRAQHKHYNTGAPGIPRTSLVSPQMHKTSFLQKQYFDIILIIHSKGNRTLQRQTLRATMQGLFATESLIG